MASIFRCYDDGKTFGERRTVRWSGTIIVLGQPQNEIFHAGATERSLEPRYDVKVVFARPVLERIDDRTRDREGLSAHGELAVIDTRR